ncbi:MAG TPA: DUF6263 family protein [Flavipsychrobacter sp.]
MNIRSYFYGIVAVLVLSSWGCGGPVDVQEIIGPVELSFNFFPDSAYRYTLKNNIALTQEIDKEKAITIHQNMTLTNAYRVIALKPDERTVSVTYERIIMSSGNQLFSLDYDSENDNGTDPMYEDLRNLIDKNFKMVISPAGKVIASEPVIRMRNERQGAYNFDDSSIRKVMLHVLQVYPSRKVEVGSIWERSYATSVGFANVRVRNRYQLISIKKGVAHIELQGRINSDNAEQTRNSDMELRGLQSGEMDIDIESGLVITGKISQQLSGNMNITGESTPVDIESDIYIMGTVINNRP